MLVDMHLLISVYGDDLDEVRLTGKLTGQLGLLGNQSNSATYLSSTAYRRRASSTDLMGKQHGANGTRGLTRGSHEGARCEAVTRGGGDSGLTDPAHDVGTPSVSLMTI